MIPFVSGQEYKFFETTLDATPIPRTGLNVEPDSTANPPVTQTMRSLNLVQQGTGASQRIGRKITVTSLYVKAFFAMIKNSMDPTITVRTIVYQDMQCNGTGLASIGELLALPEGRTPYLAFMNLANRGRFRVLANKSVTLNSGTSTFLSTAADTTTSTRFSGSGRHLTLSFPRLRIPVEIKAPNQANTPITIEHVASNNIGIIYLASSNNAVTVTHTTRIRFSDK